MFSGNQMLSDCFKKLLNAYWYSWLQLNKKIVIFLSFPGSAGLYSEIRRSQAFWSYLMPFKMLLLFIQIPIFVSCCASILSTLFFACTKHIFFLHFNLPISQIHYMLSYIFIEVNSIFECWCCFSYLLQLCIPVLFNISLNGRNTVLLTAPCLSLFQGECSIVCPKMSTYINVIYILHCHNFSNFYPSVLYSSLKWKYP